MIPLVEFSPKSEIGLLSSIGNKYGDIYEKPFELAQGSRLNQNKVPKFYETHMKPVMRKYPAPKL